MGQVVENPPAPIQTHANAMGEKQSVVKTGAPEVRSDVAQVKDGMAHPLAKEQHYETFPVDEYVDACIIAYHVADLPPSKFADNNDPVPSVRFLLSNGKIRKWTNWYRISYHSKASLPKLFTGIPDIAGILTNDERLFKQPFKILLESKDGEYSNIIRIKAGTHNLCDTVFYDKEFVPYKYVKAFGNLVNLRLAVLKTEEGVKELKADDMIEPPAVE